MVDFKEGYQILLSIKPVHATKIMDGIKKIEVRRKIGIYFAEDSEIVIYASSPMMQLVGSAKIERIEKKKVCDISDVELSLACLSRDEIKSYLSDVPDCYFIYLKDISKNYNGITIKKLREINIKPPQSFRYVDKKALNQEV